MECGCLWNLPNFHGETSGIFYQNVSEMLHPLSNLERMFGEKWLSLMEMGKNSYMKNSSHPFPFIHAYFPQMRLFVICV